MGLEVANHFFKTFSLTLWWKRSGFFFMFFQKLLIWGEFLFHCSHLRKKTSNYFSTLQINAPRNNGKVNLKVQIQMGHFGKLFKLHKENNLIWFIYLFFFAWWILYIFLAFSLSTEKLHFSLSLITWAFFYQFYGSQWVHFHNKRFF